MSEKLGNLQTKKWKNNKYKYLPYIFYVSIMFLNFQKSLFFAYLKERISVNKLWKRVIFLMRNRFTEIRSQCLQNKQCRETLLALTKVSLVISVSYCESDKGFEKIWGLWWIFPSCCKAIKMIVSRNVAYVNRKFNFI